MGTLSVIISHILLIFDGAIVPAWYLRQSCTEAYWGNEVPMLTCGLSSLFVVMLFAIVMMLPFVLRKQWQWMQIENTRSISQSFFTCAVIVEIRKRFMIQNILRVHLGDNLSHEI